MRAIAFSVICHNLYKVRMYWYIIYMSNIVGSCPDCGISFDYFIAADVWACKRCGYGLPEHLRKPQKQVMSAAGDNTISKAIQKVKSKTSTKESENTAGGASGVILPMDTKRKGLYRRSANVGPYVPGEDPDINRIQARGGIIISSETYLPKSDGNFVLDTYNTAEKLDEKLRERRKFGQQGYASPINADDDFENGLSV